MIQCDGDLKITMDLGDWGMEIPFEISGNVQSKDAFVFYLAAGRDRPPIIHKDVAINADGIFTLFLTHDESNKLAAGTYFWSLKQFRKGQLLNTVVNNKYFEVLKGVQSDG